MSPVNTSQAIALRNRFAASLPPGMEAEPCAGPASPGMCAASPPISSMPAVRPAHSRGCAVASSRGRGVSWSRSASARASTCPVTTPPGWSGWSASTPTAPCSASPRPKSRAMPFAVECIRAGGQSLPLADGIADTVVVTYAFCTIPDRGRAERNPPRAEADGPTDPHRARSGRGTALPPLAGAPEPAVGINCRRLPPQPRSAATDRGAGFRLLEVQHGRFPLPLWQLGSHHAGIAAAS